MTRWFTVALLAGMVAACRPIAPTPVTQTNLLQFNQTVEQSLIGPDAEQNWLFSGQSGQLITIALEVVGPPLSLSLYGPSGATIPMQVSDSATPASLTRAARLPETGSYRLAVALRISATTTYRLTITEVQPFSATPTPVSLATSAPVPAESPLAMTPLVTATGAPLRVGSGARLQPYRPIRGQIVDFGATEHYTILAPAGTVVTIGASHVPGSPVRPALMLFAPSGDILARSIEIDTQAIIAGIQLPVTGAYVVYVSAVGDQASGPYDLAFGYGVTFREVVLPEPEPDLVYAGVLELPFTRDIWPIRLTIGDIISAAVVADNARFSPILTLLSPDGQPLYTGLEEEGRAALRQVIAPQTGQFYLAVAPAEGYQGGPYTLLWQYNARAPTPPPEN
ncbi:MAG: hypothetical protein HPY64_00655 [Anaerolineae bacterium]|nr:hypothetical protein [Anaerolineae bacterium]